jgi:multidrug efflux system membrane fusion protein
MRAFTKIVFFIAVLFGPASWAAEPVSVVAMPSQAETHARALVLRGRTEPDRTVELRAEVGGLIVGEPLSRGSRVSAGDAICRIDPGERPAALAEARATALTAEAEVDAAEQLVERGFTSQTETLRRRAALETARARLMLAELDMARLTIRAPFDGILDEDSAERGTLLRPGDPCATVIAADPILVVGFVAERSVGGLARGQVARGRLVTGREIEGSVRFVGRTADPDTRTFRVEIVVANPDLSIPDGMTAEVAVRLDATLAHRLPQSALTLNGDGVMGVRVVEEGVARFYGVTIIDDEPTGMWVTGLPDAATVIVVGQEFVADGVPVAATIATPEELAGAL